MTNNQRENNNREPFYNKLSLPTVILSMVVLVLLFVDVFAIYALKSNSDALSITSTYFTWANNRFISTLSRVKTANDQLSSMQTQLKSTQEQLASAQAEITLYQNTYGEVYSGNVHPALDVNGQFITLVSNPAATNPTFAQLESFIISDTTDQNTYAPGVYVCADFARDVFNNAEKAGIRAGFVDLEFPNDWHGCDVFQTTDKGLVFIDCTGGDAATKSQEGAISFDKIVNIKLGNDYIPVSLVSQFGSASAWGDYGKIIDVQIYW